MAANDADRHEIAVPDPDDPDDWLESTGRRTQVEVDPDLANFAHSPYDPLYAARVEGRLLGELIREPPRGGFLRVMSGLVGLVLALPILVALLAGGFGIGFLGLGSILGIAGLALLVRALRG